MFACRRLVLVLLLALPLVAHCALLLNPYAQSPTRIPFLRIDEPTSLSASAAFDDSEITFNVALRQRNIAALHERVRAVSSPDSIDYGNYWTVEQVAELIAPSDEALAFVAAYFAKRGATLVAGVRTRDFLTVRMRVRDAAALFETRFAAFRHRVSARRIVRAAEHVRVPDELHAHIDVITGLHDFFDDARERRTTSLFGAVKSADDAVFQQSHASAAATAAATAAAPSSSSSSSSSSSLSSSCSNAPEVPRPRGSEKEILLQVILRCADSSAPTDAVKPCASTGNPITAVAYTLVPHDGASAPVHGSYYIGDLDCAAAGGAVRCTFPAAAIPSYARLNISIVQQYASAPFVSAPGHYLSLYSPSPFLTPRTFYDTYGVPHGARATHPRNSQAVTAFELQYVNISYDLRTFDAYMGLPFEAPTIWGQNDETQPGGESTLDLQWISAIAPGAKTIFFSVTGSGPAVPPGQGAYILEWALLVANLTDADAPKVTSISYGDTEIGFFNKFGDFSYVERMEIELAKMAVRGLTVVAGSGDAGASNVGEAGNDVSPTDPTCAPFRAFYPSSSPYVLSLSSTFLTTAYLPVCEQSMGPLPVQCTQVGERSVSLRDGLYWTTGGGFSNRTNNPTAKYQQRQVQSFLSTAGASGLLPPTAGGVWNAGGRGYPDIATLGHNLLFVFAGALGTVDGTSASGPVAAGLLTLVNDALLNAGLPTLGLVNPMLYALQVENPYAFNDVVMGSNFDGDWQPSCGAAYPSLCPFGFTTQPGWDPVSGLGTPNFPVIRQAALDLMRAASTRRQK